MTASGRAVPKKKIRMTGDRIAVSIFGYVAIGLFALICLAPFYLILIASFTPENDMIRNGYPVLPGAFSTEAYALCLKNPMAILRAYGLTCEEMTHRCRRAKVALTGGTFFGAEGEGFMRVNFACPRTQLKEGIRRLGAALEEH